VTFLRKSRLAALSEVSIVSAVLTYTYPTAMPTRVISRDWILQSVDHDPSNHSKTVETTRRCLRTLLLTCYVPIILSDDLHVIGFFGDSSRI
jgi:hypothetical protein